jgi:hypothetical protein
MVAFVVGAPVVALTVGAWLWLAPPLSAHQHYFPPQGDPRVARRSWFWLGSFLAYELERAGEQPWWPPPAGVEGYRLFQSGPGAAVWIVRVERSAAGLGVVLRTNYADSPFLSRRALTASEWDDLDRAFTAAAFWATPWAKEQSWFHGEEVILEGVREGRYQLWTAWSPNGNNAEGKAMLKLMDAMKTAAGH